MTVNGLRLPDAFVALIDRPQPLVRWKPRGGDQAWIYKGGEGGLYWIPTPGADSAHGLTTIQLFGSLAEVEEETNRLPITFHVAEYTPEEIAEWDASYAHLPGFLPFLSDFSKIVYFGDTDAGEAFCFDYRESPEEPSVIHWADAYWRRFAPNFDAFISLFDDEAERGRLELDDELF
jgi:hypothetical protein